MDNSKEIQELSEKLIRLQNENRLLKEKSALEVQELQTANARLKADVMGAEHNLNIVTVSRGQSSDLIVCTYTCKYRYEWKGLWCSVTIRLLSMQI